MTSFVGAQGRLFLEQSLQYFLWNDHAHSARLCDNITIVRSRLPANVIDGMSSLRNFGNCAAHDESEDIQPHDKSTIVHAVFCVAIALLDEAKICDYQEQVRRVKGLADILSHGDIQATKKLLRDACEASHSGVLESATKSSQRHDRTRGRSRSGGRHTQEKGVKVVRQFREHSRQTLSLTEGQQLVRAFYGDYYARKGADVTTKAKQLLESKGFLEASNVDFGDPLKGAVKYLTIDLRG